MLKKKKAKYENTEPLNYSCVSGVIDGLTVISNVIGVIKKPGIMFIVGIL